VEFGAVGVVAGGRTGRDGVFVFVLSASANPLPEGAPMRLKTFAGHDTAKLDEAVNAFIEGEPIEVIELSYHSNSFSYVVFLEYEPR